MSAQAAPVIDVDPLALLVRIVEIREGELSNAIRETEDATRRYGVAVEELVQRYRGIASDPDAFSLDV